VTLFWRITLKVAFVGYMENVLYVLDFWKKATKLETLMDKSDLG
jgi:hypothetical protein